MADTWPQSVPKFIVEGYSRGGEDGVLRSQFPGGMKVRPQFTKPPPQAIAGAVICTLAQLQTLVDFWEITLKRVLPFDMQDSARPGVTATYRFTARPSYTAIAANLYRVELALEQLNTSQGTFLTDIEGLTT